MRHGGGKLRVQRDSSILYLGGKFMGCSVLGDEDSPVIPMMLFNPTKIASFSRECLARGLAVVVVGAPAVPIYGARVRFCISAGHKREDLKEALKKIREVCNILNLRYERSIFG
jgi:serine palmitoyltransferase